MVGTVKPGGWFVIDFLNPARVRSRLVPAERLMLDGDELHITRSVSPDGRFIRKTIESAGGRRFVERVRLFEPDEIAAMLAASGAAARHRFGDYDASAQSSSSPRTIMMGQKG